MYLHKFTEKDCEHGDSAIWIIFIIYSDRYARNKGKGKYMIGFH